MKPKTYALWVDVTPENADILVSVLSAQLPNDVKHRIGDEGGLIVGEPVIDVQTVMISDSDGIPHQMRRVTCQAQYLTADQLPRTIRENWDMKD